MEKFTLKKLEKTLDNAKRTHKKYFFVMVQIDGMLEEEILINPIENAEEKLAYYKWVYDENGVHRFSEGVRITRAGFADSLQEIEAMYL